MMGSEIPRLLKGVKKSDFHFPICIGDFELLGPHHADPGESPSPPVSLREYLTSAGDSQRSHSEAATGAGNLITDEAVSAVLKL